MSLFAVLLLSGCNESTINLNRPPVEPGIPSISVMPPALEWGQLTSDESETQSFVVRNIGDTLVTVEDIVIEGVPAYEILSPTAFLVEADAEVVVEVAFAPYTANNDARAVVFSDDPDEPATYVQLSGLGSVPELTISPDPHDFGVLDIPCSETVLLTLANTGAEPLVISAIDHVSDGSFTLFDDNALPVTVPVGASTDVEVVWTASAAGLAEGELIVTSNDPREVVASTQTGTADYVDYEQEVVEIPENPPVDVLFAIDQSCSMDTHSTLLGSNFSAFIGAIDDVTTDWQLGVANVDDGCLIDGVLTASTPDYTGTFASAAVQGDDPGGLQTYSEKLLQLADLALSQTDPGECNAGFLRPGANLHIILVSDEPNRSPQPWTNYQASFESHLTDPDLLTVSAVLDDSNCGYGGEGYPEIVNATGGLVLDLCGSWSSSVDSLGEESVEEVDTVQLVSPAAPSTLEVSIAGASATGWSYDDATNSVSFDPPLAEGTTVTLDYAVLATCE